MLIVIVINPKTEQHFKQRKTVQYMKFLILFVSDACLRCQSENKQDDCVGKYLNCRNTKIY